MTAILIVIIAILALYIKDLYELYAVCRRQVNDVHDYYNKVLRNNAEITAALFPQIIRELEELGEVKEANKCKGILADAEKELAKKGLGACTTAAAKIYFQDGLIKKN